MTYATPFTRASLALVAVAALALSGCNQDDKALRAEDDSNPYFHTANARIQERNFAEAAKAYEAALRANPDVAQAHYELGLLYADKLNDPVAAVYHYQLYLKARPAADNSPNAQERLNAAEINFAASLPNSPIQNAQAIASLQSSKLDLQRDLETANKNAADLQAKLASAQKELAAASPGLQPAGAAPAGGLQDTTPPAATAAAAQPPVPPAVAPATAVAVPPSPSVSSAAPAIAVNPAPAPAQATLGAAQAYTVVKGDTPWKIAAKFYPGHVAAGVAKIQAANPDMKPNQLKIGTTLQIPQ